MGLDMYLTAKRYISGYFDEQDKERADIIKSVFPELADVDVKNVKGVDVRIGYWRKANAIHQWFVDNVQNGVDECQETELEREDLLKLKSVCEAVIADRTKAKELLPTASGFFFGTTEYDGFYFEDLQDTIDIVNNALALPDSWSFTYRSSW